MKCDLFLNCDCFNRTRLSSRSDCSRHAFRWLVGQQHKAAICLYLEDLRSERLTHPSSSASDMIDSHFHYRNPLFSPLQHRWIQMNHQEPGLADTV